MSKVIKNGTIVTADRTWKADVFIKHGKIEAIGPDLHGDHEFDATGCYVMPAASIRTPISKCPSWAPIRPTISKAARAPRCPAAPRWSSTLPAGAGPVAARGAADVGQQDQQGLLRLSFHMAVTRWGEQVFNEMQTVVEKGITSFKHFMAYKGALMVNDDEMYASFQRCAELGALPLVHAENGDVVAALSRSCLPRAITGRRAMPIRARRRWRARPQIAPS
jgi:dihydropyrimidinase